MVRSDKTVILFTQWFPYNKVMEQSFLADEIIHLQSNFKKLYIVPQRIEGDLFELPEGIEMDDSLAKSLTSISLENEG